MHYHNILLASHGTPGARAAEQLALSLVAPSARLRHLYVVPDLWKGMMGDDWLNNARTRTTYGNYVEGTLQAEMDADLARVAALVTDRGLDYLPHVAVGKPADLLVELLAQEPTELVVIGSPRPKGMEGIRSRLDFDTLARALSCPLIVAPYPRD